MILEALLKNQINSQTLIEFLSQKEDLYLVGGAVRDYLLGIESHDLDFVMGGDVIKTARGAARAVGGKYYVLDDVRSTARVILPGESRFSLDFAHLRGDTLHEDLKARDFTINAIAVNIHNPEVLVDPLGGVQDLHDRVLRNCSERTYTDDPIRILRAIRLAFQFTLKFEKGSLGLLKVAIPELSKVSTERIRDEIFHMLDANQSHSAFRSLEMLGVLRQILPGLMNLKGTPSAGNNSHNRWEFALSMLRELDRLTNVIFQKRSQDDAGNLALAMVNSELGIYIGKLSDYLSHCLADDRKLVSLLKIAGLYSMYALHKDGLTEPLNDFHSIVSDQRKLSEYFLKQFALSKDESIRLAEILLNLETLDRFSGLILAEDRRGIYQYFKLSGSAGLDVAILKLSQVLAESGNDLHHKNWLDGLSVVRVLCHAWFERHDEWIQPVRMLSGFDVQKVLEISPGPVLGQILGALEESQAAGELCTPEEAVTFIMNWYGEHSNSLNKM